MAATTVKVKEILENKGSEGLATALVGDGMFILDFAGVESVSFAALRVLISRRRAGKGISVINACEKVAERFEDSGVSALINVTRVPKPLDISEYSEFGGGFLSTAYNSQDGDSMLKMYGRNVPDEVVIREKNVARSVLLFGLNTPMVGTIYDCDGNKGLDFERIEGKRSFSRIISEEPSRMEELTVRFAKMCTQLHGTQCNTAVFGEKSAMYRNVLASSSAVDDLQRAKVMTFLDSVPVATTCLHGDMQLSNVITNGKEDFWIDLSDFAYGNHMFDLGMWYFLAMLNPEELCQHIFHLGKEQMAQIWDIFIREYFGASSDASKEEVSRMVEPFAALHMLYLGSLYGFKPGMMEYVKGVLSL